MIKVITGDKDDVHVNPWKPVENTITLKDNPKSLNELHSMINNLKKGQYMLIQK